MRASTRFVSKKFASCVGLQESRKETKQMSTIRYDGGFLLYFCSLFFLFYSFFCGEVYRMIAVLYKEIVDRVLSCFYFSLLSYVTLELILFCIP